jgi:cyclic pyranopterin phosphate synthase
MVDVSAKRPTRRRAVAAGSVRFGIDAFALLRANRLAKGDALAVARIAGIQAAKRVADLVPLCHPVPLEHVAVEIELDVPGRLARVRAEAVTRWSTGVEMEALAAVCGACLALYDMTKAIDRGIVVERIELLAKAGGRSGRWSRAGSGGEETP